MTARKIRPVFDDLTSQNSFRLNVSLADFLPNTRQRSAHTPGTKQATIYANPSPSAVLRTHKTSVRLV
ncbi:hypothetical protein KCU75_g4898, partial [Aureobasidium melanogenum]